MSGDPAQDYLGPGVAEEIITLLSTYPGLRVVSRTSSFFYDKPVRVQQVAQDLGVAYVLEGSVKKAAGKIHIIAQLVDATTGDHVWAERYEEEGGDVVALQVDVGEQFLEQSDSVCVRLWQHLRDLARSPSVGRHLGPLWTSDLRAALVDL
jgi:adenylate cyclase